MANLKLDKAQIMAALEKVVEQAHDSIRSAAALLGADVEQVAEVLGSPAQHLSINLAAHAEVLDFSTLQSSHLNEDLRDIGVDVVLMNDRKYFRIPYMRKGKYRVIVLFNRISD